MTPYMTIIIICVLIIAYGILFYYYCKAEDNKRRYLWNIYYGEHKQMTPQESQIISDIIEDIEKEIDKEYTDNLCDNQLIRAGYLGALCIIKNHVESVSK